LKSEEGLPAMDATILDGDLSENPKTGPKGSKHTFCVFF
jgi:hypothetical protein